MFLLSFDDYISNLSNLFKFYLLMIITSPTAVPPNSQKRVLKIIGKILIFLLVLGGLGYLIWHLGSPKTHTQKNHRLYSSFDQSPSHKKLISNLHKQKLSNLFGKKENGLYQFIQHLANKLHQKGRKVIVESSNNKGFVIEFANGVHLQLAKQIGLYDNNTDWIFVSQNGQAFPEPKIKQVQQNYPNSKIIIVTPNKQKIKGFKTFQFPQVGSKLLEKSIAKSFKVKESMAVILTDYFETDEELFDKLHKDQLNIKDSDFLGEQFKSIEGLGKKEQAVLKRLCKDGSFLSKIKFNNDLLASYGAINVGCQFVWLNKKKILNYEYHTNQNCVNKVATEKQLSQYQEAKQQEEQKKIKQEEEKRIKQEASKAAQQKRIEQELKKQEQLKQKQQEQKAAKKAKQEKAPKKKEGQQNSKKSKQAPKQGKKK